MPLCCQEDNLLVAKPCVTPIRTTFWGGKVEIFPIDFRLRNLVRFGIRIPHEGMETAPQEFGTELVQEFRAAGDLARRASNVDRRIFVDFHGCTLLCNTGHFC